MRIETGESKDAFARNKLLDECDTSQPSHCVGDVNRIRSPQIVESQHTLFNFRPRLEQMPSENPCQ